MSRFGSPAPGLAEDMKNPAGNNDSTGQFMTTSTTITLKRPVTRRR
jgi:hypothetical protein